MWEGHGDPSEFHYSGLRLRIICICHTPSASVAAECISFALVEIMQVIHQFVTLLYELQKTKPIHLWSFTHQFTGLSVPARLFRTKM